MPLRFSEIRFACAAFASFSLCLATFATAQGTERCGSLPEVLQLGKDETIITATVNEARDLYRWACVEQSGSSGGSSSSSLKLLYDDFSAGAKRESTSFEDFQRKNCHLSSETVANYVSTSLRKRTISSAVLDAWASCRERESGISLGPNVREDQTLVTFDITYDDKKLASAPILRGISSETFECKTAGDGKKIGVGGDPLKISTREALVIECHRHSSPITINDRAAISYRRDSLLLDLSTGSYRIDFTKRREGPAVEEFAELQGLVRQLGDDLKTLKDRQQEFQSLNRLKLTKTVEADPGYWGTWRKKFYCPANYYLCGLQQRIEKRRGKRSHDDDSAMNGLRMFCCPLFDIDPADSASSSSLTSPQGRGARP